MELTRTERWILSNQFRILSKLDSDQAGEYERMAEIMECGYELEYDSISQNIYDDSQTMSADDCSEVLHILDMFNDLQYAYNHLDDKSGVKTTWIEFPGFWGNNETAYLHYARFILDQESGFSELKRGWDYNSHMPALDHYRQMLYEWEKSSDKHNLTKDDLIRITSV